MSARASSLALPAGRGRSPPSACTKPPVSCISRSSLVRTMEAGDVFAVFQLGAAGPGDLRVQLPRGGFQLHIPADKGLSGQVQTLGLGHPQGDGVLLAHQLIHLLKAPPPHGPPVAAPSGSSGCGKRRSSRRTRRGSRKRYWLYRSMTLFCTGVPLRISRQAALSPQHLDRPGLGRPGVFDPLALVADDQVGGVPVPAPQRCPPGGWPRS